MIAAAGSPFPASFFHVFAPSRVFQIPLIGPPPLKPHGTRRR